MSGDTADRPWWRPALNVGTQSGCLNCGGRPVQHPLDGELGVGFGICEVTKDDEVVWREKGDEDEFPTLATFESLAIVDPDHDWTVTYEAPMWNGTWQRHGEGRWELVEKGMGFA